MRKTILVVLLLAVSALAKDKKNYPVTGTVVSFHSQAEIGGFSDNTGNYVGTYERRIYVLKTDSGTIEITGADNNFKARSRPDLTVGRAISYRSEKAYIYTVLENGKEYRYRVLSAQ